MTLFSDMKAQSVHWVLDCLLDYTSNFHYSSVTLHRLDAVLVILFQYGEILGPLLVPGADHSLLIFLQLDQSLQLSWISWLGNLHVEVLPSHWVNPSIGALADTLVSILLKDAHKAWLDSHGLEQVDLRLRLRESIKDPSIDAAVALAYSLIYQSQQDLIRDRFTLVGSLLDLNLDWWVPLSLFLEDLLWTDQNKTESFRGDLSLGCFT